MVVAKIKTKKNIYLILSLYFWIGTVLINAIIADKPHTKANFDKVSRIFLSGTYK
jgi:hypothetical protein